MNRLRPWLPFLLVLAAAWSASAAEKVVYQEDSLYFRIFVLRDGDLVTLRLGRPNGPLTTSQMDLAHPDRHCLAYSAVTYCGLFYQPAPRRMLFIGLGGGIIPRDMHRLYPEATIDVVELDPAVAAVARRFFAFNEDKLLRVHIADGRMFVRKALRLKEPPKYDYIVLDAFNAEYIPFHLLTREFFEELRGVLADDGVVVANVFHSNRLFQAQMVTINAVFGKCQAYYVPSALNAILVAPGPKGAAVSVKEAVEKAKDLQPKHAFSFSLAAIARCLRPLVRVPATVSVLTDDRAPVNWLREQKTETEK